MVQPNSQYGESIYFPYVAGSLIAYAFADERIERSYTFVRFFYKKESIEAIVENLDRPDVLGFSCYVWNYQFNCAIARAVKKKYPECVIVFGGHQVNEESAEECADFADYVMLGEGEQSFLQLLLFLDGQCPFADVPNVMACAKDSVASSMRMEGGIAERVSPYLAGLFDALIAEEPLAFSAILETNRGCPNRCAFCDWGNVKSKIKSFSLETVFREIDWMAEHQIEYCYCADSNFGLFPRDLEIVDYLIQKHSQTGYPQKFQATYSKNNPETVFEINKRLNEVGMSKGATLSFQSMSDDVLRKIYRQNMPLSSFKKLMSLYNSHHISSYSEIIIALPGETYDSFRDGIEQLLESGQHMSINFFNCELLRNSIMNDPSYKAEYAIRSALTEQHQYHTLPHSKLIPEYSQIVVETASLSSADWIRCNILSVYVRTFHNLGLLQCFAIYLYYEKDIPYLDFYESLLRASSDGSLPLCTEIFNWLSELYKNVVQGGGTLTCQQDEFGEITWPLDEGAFLKLVYRFDAFYEEITSFLKPYFDDALLFDELMCYQKAVVKNPWAQDCALHFHFDFYSYFSEIYQNAYKPMARKEHTLSVRCDSFQSFKDYAYQTIWYGRKGGKNIVDTISYVD